MRYLVSLEVDSALAPRVDARALEAMYLRVLDEDGLEDGSGVTLVLSDDLLLRDLNERHRGIDAPTDVLSFPTREGEAQPGADAERESYLGDVVISVEMVERNALEAAITAGEELAHVALHGLLHVLGYDHEQPDDETRMNAREEAILGPAIHAAGGAHED